MQSCPERIPHLTGRTLLLLATLIGLFTLSALPVPSALAETLSATATPTSTSKTVTLKPIADAHVVSNQPDRNLGSLDFLMADHDPVREAHLKFQLPELSGPVSSARLRLFAIDPSSDAGTVARMSDTT